MNLNYYKWNGSHIFRIEDQLVLRAGYFVMYNASYFVKYSDIQKLFIFLVREK